ncbi:serine/threonine-protein kinase runkel [Quercus suber]|uniref:Serine/threonine-protein kinase runkel n=1 Tax=Quercus suber TaxID=58331 RepID=A0AAW0JN30_QUESU
MNHYHIYQAIGRGKYSTVYKGRKKKTIEYFAIKSVDKLQKSKVLQEVRVLHSLDHPNVLQFYSWYETSAHFVLVLEYCVGGDLMTLLCQDSQLPEDSIHDIARDLLKALQYLHSKGIIYCDLKPSNILLDENGRTKLCDFGLARKLSEISKTPSSLLPQAKRGTPFYMAPELFEDGGVHSYASDFWALGCVLYECYAGRPPFMGGEFTQLVRSILSDPVPPLPGNPSRPFVNLINSLLVKDPAERIQWPELCGHAFWRTRFTPVPLPPQPAFTNMIEQYARPCLSERNGDKSLQNKTPPKYREKDVKGAPKQDENSVLGSRGYETPIKGTQSGRRTQTKASGRVVEEKQKNRPSATRGVNLLRLSRIAKTNLQRENEKENYRRPLPNGSENDAEVKIENTDMELDFNENAEDEAHDESDSITCTPEDKMSSQDQHQGKVEDVENNTHQFDTPVNMPAPDESKPLDQESSSEHIEVAATPPSVSPQLKNQRIKDGSGSVPDSDSSKSSNNISQVLWHPSDLSVRPVMPSRKADKLLEVIPSLPFEALQASDFVKMPEEQLDALNGRITSILSGNTSIGEKQNVIRYLEMLSTNADAANILTNGPIMLILVKMLRQSKVSALRVQLASLVGLLIRHSTFIKDDLANSGILGSLSDGLRDKQDKVRRFSMAALGELLFYISTQNDQTRENNPPESPSKDYKSTSGWQVSNSLISLVSSILRKGEDDMTQLYALRTIENICSQGGHWGARFTSQDVISNVSYIYRASGKQESIRLTAGSCLVRLVRFNPSSIQSVIEKLSFKEIASALGRDDFQITLLRVLESVTEESPVILENPFIFIREILPSLAVLYKGNKDGDARFLCLKILFDVMVIFFDEPFNDEQRSEDLKSIANTHFLPLYPALIEDEDPIPMYAQKLLVMFIEFNYIRISNILHLKIVSQCFEFLLGDLSSANVNNVKLCLALASAPEMESKLLSQLKVVRRIGNLLEFVYAKDMEDFLEPTLGLCRAFLLRSISSRKGFIYTKEPTLLSDGSAEENSAVDQQQSIRDIMDFGSNVGVLLELSESHEANVADIASECVVLLLMAAPREATTGLLTNLPKVSAILESSSRATSHLLVLRVLHALGYSCRQYLSQAMILSISVHEISRVEAIVSELKSSGVRALANAALNVALELQRLPRMASFWFHLGALINIIMAFMVSPLLSLSPNLNSDASNTISTTPSFLTNSPPSLSPFQEISPDIAPLLPSPGGEVPTSTGSSIPTIPSSPSPPNPDELDLLGPNSALSPSGSMPASSAESKFLVSYLNIVFAGLAAYWCMQPVKI